MKDDSGENAFLAVIASGPFGRCRLGNPPENGIAASVSLRVRLLAWVDQRSLGLTLDDELLSETLSIE